MTQRLAELVAPIHVDEFMSTYWRREHLFCPGAAERFAGLGVHVVRGAASFVDKATVIAGDSRIKARRFVIATADALVFE